MILALLELISLTVIFAASCKKGLLLSFFPSMFSVISVVKNLGV
jgi:hypothetical protein